jgi:hypothetical protein
VPLSTNSSWCRLVLRQTIQVASVCAVGTQALFLGRNRQSSGSKSRQKQVATRKLPNASFQGRNPLPLNKQSRRWWPRHGRTKSIDARSSEPSAGPSNKQSKAVTGRCFRPSSNPVPVLRTNNQRSRVWPRHGRTKSIDLKPFSTQCRSDIKGTKPSASI